MGGAKDSSNSPVVDIMSEPLLPSCVRVDANVLHPLAVNQDSFVFATHYLLSKSLPPAQYHFRVNISNASVSAASDTFTVTAPTFDCLHPPAWVDVTSTSDSNYRSLRLMNPQAGSVLSNTGEILVAWDYRVSLSFSLSSKFCS